MFNLKQIRNRFIKKDKNYKSDIDHGYDLECNTLSYIKNDEFSSIYLLISFNKNSSDMELWNITRNILSSFNIRYIEKSNTKNDKYMIILSGLIRSFSRLYNIVNSSKSIYSDNKIIHYIINEAETKINSGEFEEPFIKLSSLIQNIESTDNISPINISVLEYPCREENKRILDIFSEFECLTISYMDIVISEKIFREVFNSSVPYSYEYKLKSSEKVYIVRISLIELFMILGSNKNQSNKEIINTIIFNIRDIFINHKYFNICNDNTNDSYINLLQNIGCLDFFEFDNDSFYNDIDEIID